MPISHRVWCARSLRSVAMSRSLYTQRSAPRSPPIDVKMQWRARLLLLLIVTIGTQALADQPPAAAIASAHPLATRAGHEVLSAGGNAFDAAVAVTAALAVVEPMSSGLGGGGFWLLHRARDGFETMLDGREKAPLAARRDMYLDDGGEV